MEQFLQVIGQIVLYGGGISAIIYGTLRWFGKKWFEHQFNQKLEEFKREQDEILEHTRFEISKRFDRITKIHEKEFDVLPKAWNQLQNAYGKLTSVASPLQQWPDLNQYSNNELESFLSKCELHDFQKKELRETDDKLNYYQEKAYWIRLNSARNDFHQFQNYLHSNKIFLSRDLFGLFSQIETVMIRAQVELEHPPNEPWRDTFDTFQELKIEMDELLEQLERAVQERLHFEQ